MEDYALLDSGEGLKLERFGSYILQRPASVAFWAPEKAKSFWNKAHASFLRDPDNCWRGRRSLPEEWEITVSNIRFKLSATDFGHIGLFPEQKSSWEWIQNIVAHAKEERKEAPKVLNLFAYSGGSTLAAALAGAEVCHLDASKGMVAWARENAALNGLKEAPIRWIVDDVMKFLQRELRRGTRYDAIILDPPTFGRGNQGEIFKIEFHLQEILDTCQKLLTKQPLFLLFTCHTPGLTPIVAEHLLGQMMRGYGGEIESGEMCLSGEGALSLPSGIYARWYERRD